MHRLIVLIFIVASLISKAQIPDVLTAFSALSPIPQVIHWRNDHVSIPSGGHLQGIQALSDSQLVITSSSGSYSFYLSAIINGNTCDIRSLHKITDAPFRHAGGGQVYDHKMMVGVEDNETKDKSEIIMVSFDGAGRQVGQHTIAHRGGVVKRSTAGAVGVTKLHTGQYLVAVGDWDSRYIDFYLSRPGIDTLFDSLTTYHTPDHQKLCSYQTINLLTDTAGHIYMIGMGLDGLKNRADLYEVNLHPDRAELNLLSTKNFNCKGAGFRYSSGINVTKDQKLVIYANGMHIGPQTAINVFR